MTVGSTAAGRMPRDVRARERLREAQAAESRAVAAVCAAGEALSRACGRREATVAAATVKVEQAHAVVAHAQAALIAVSGLDRAAVLLGVDAGELRKNAGTRHGRTTARAKQ